MDCTNCPTLDCSFGPVFEPTLQIVSFLGSSPPHTNSMVDLMAAPPSEYVRPMVVSGMAQILSSANSRMNHPRQGTFAPQGSSITFFCPLCFSPMRHLRHLAALGAGVPFGAAEG